MRELLFITSNQNKVKEAEEILQIPIEHIPLDLKEIQSLKLEEIIEDKAKEAYARMKKPVIVEDVGLFIHEWNGFPGPLVKHLVEAVGNEGILKMLQRAETRSAIAKAVIGLYDGTTMHTFTGSVSGTISYEPRGESWGWDPIFIPLGSSKTYGEMQREEKNQISHRKAAFEQLKEYLQQPE